MRGVDLTSLQIDASTLNGTGIAQVLRAFSPTKNVDLNEPGNYIRFVYPDMGFPMQGILLSFGPTGKEGIEARAMQYGIQMIVNFSAGVIYMRGTYQGKDSWSEWRGLYPS